VPVEASVASVTARLRSVVTWASEPSATCSAPTPSLALRADCVSAVTLACKPLAMARPAASSAPLLMRDPDDSWNSVVCRLLLVMVNWFSAAIEAMLFKMVSAIECAPIGSDVWDPSPKPSRSSFRSSCGTHLRFNRHHRRTESRLYFRRYHPSCLRGNLLARASSIKLFSSALFQPINTDEVSLWRTFVPSRGEP